MNREWQRWWEVSVFLHGYRWISSNFSVWIPFSKALTSEVLVGTRLRAEATHSKDQVDFGPVLLQWSWFGSKKSSDQNYQTWSNSMKYKTSHSNPHVFTPLHHRASFSPGWHRPTTFKVPVTATVVGNQFTSRRHSFGGAEVPSKCKLFGKEVRSTWITLPYTFLSLHVIMCHIFFHIISFFDVAAIFPFHPLRHIFGVFQLQD